MPTPRKTSASGSASAAGSGSDKLAAITDWTAENVHHAIQATADELEVGMGKVGMPLRVAVTGAGQSPALDVTVHAIGKTRSIERINKALAFIAERENQQ